GLVAPLVEHDHRELGVPVLLCIPARHSPQAMGYTGAEYRRLPYSARPVQHRQPSGEYVRADELALAFTPEEEERVELAVLEWDEPFVRAVRNQTGAASATRRPRSATKSSRLTS